MALNAKAIGYAKQTVAPELPTAGNVRTYIKDNGRMYTIDSAGVEVEIGGAETDPVFTAWDKDYNDLSNKPTLFTGANVPANETDPIFTAWDKDYNDLTNKPTLFTGINVPANETDPIFTAWDKDYNDLTNKPDLFVGTDVTANETDPMFTASVAASITETDKTNWDAAKTHADSTHAPIDAQKNSDITKAEIEAKLTGEIDSHTHAGGGVVSETDPVFTAWDKDYTDLTNKPTLFIGTDVPDNETDPVFGASAAAGITTQDIDNWNAGGGVSDPLPNAPATSQSYYVGKPQWVPLTGVASRDSNSLIITGVGTQFTTELLLYGAMRVAGDTEGTYGMWTIDTVNSNTSVTVYQSGDAFTSQALEGYNSNMLGDDNNDGLTGETAFATIQKAIDQISSFSNTLTNIYLGYHEDTTPVTISGKHSGAIDIEVTDMTTPCNIPHMIFKDSTAQITYGSKVEPLSMRETFKISVYNVRSLSIRKVEITETIYATNSSISITTIGMMANIIRKGSNITEDYALRADNSSTISVKSLFVDNAGDYGIIATSGSMVYGLGCENVSGSVANTYAGDDDSGTFISPY